MGAVTLLVNSTCREVTIIWCVSAVVCNIGEVNPHFAEEVLANSWAATGTIYSAIVVFVCSRLPLKSARTAHVYIPNMYYAHAWRHRFRDSCFGCLHGKDGKIYMEKIYAFLVPKTPLSCKRTGKTHKQFPVFGWKHCRVNGPLNTQPETRHRWQLLDIIMTETETQQKGSGGL